MGQAEGDLVKAYDVASYRRGWSASERASEGALERADMRNEPNEWYDGYMDFAAVRPKYHSRDHDPATCKEH